MSDFESVIIKQKGTAFDVFGRLRVSEPHTIFDSKQVNDKQPLFFDEVIAGSATSTHQLGQAAVDMTVTTNGDYVIRETFMSFNYQPGKAQYILMTGILGEPTASTESRLGYFNTSSTAPYTANRDGLYFGQDGTDKYVAVSNNGTENKITQANWSEDTMDGNGPSGITLDWDENQIWFMDFEWLGVGIVRFGHVIDGSFVVCHIESHVNDASITRGAYMTTPNHSVRYEVRSTGGAMTMKHICCSVMSEGGVQPSGVTRSISNGVTSVSCGTAIEGILFMRVNSARPCTDLTLSNFGILNTANNTNNFRYALILNPVIAGTAPTWVNLSDSAIDYAVGNGANTLSGGTYLTEGYIAGSLPNVTSPSELVIRPGVAIDGTQDVIALAIQTFSGTDTFVGEMDLLEVTCG